MDPQKDSRKLHFQGDEGFESLCLPGSQDSLLFIQVPLEPFGSSLAMVNINVIQYPLQEKGSFTFTASWQK